jgi:hypothetical protein
MGVDQIHPIVVTLEQPDDLLHTPDFDPFNGKTRSSVSAR